MPLSADSLKMNCQYFAYDKNTQTSGTHSAAVSGFAADEVSWFGDSYGGQVSSSVQAQMNSQHSRHSIAGTLVVSITCTHKEAALLAPFILDVDKGIRVWNSIYPDDMIKTNSITNMAETAMLSATEGEKSFSVLSGATYGSCFIGMVHILNTSQTTSSQVMDTMAESIKAQFKYGGWFAEETGSFGVDSSFSNDAKNLLSTQKISSHCSLVSMGSIPSIKSNQVEMGSSRIYARRCCKINESSTRNAKCQCRNNGHCKLSCSKSKRWEAVSQYPSYQGKISIKRPTSN